MPELPEVQTVVTGLNKHLPGLKILSCEILRSNIIQGNIETFCNTLTGKSFKQVIRRGKYIIFQFQDGLEMLGHLRMTGKFIFHVGKNHENPYNRVIFYLENNIKLIYNDLRCFGTLELTPNAFELPSVKKLGWEPFDKNLTPQILWNQIKQKKSPIKNFLLNQEEITGLGNIYVSEILFASRIHPARTCSEISLNETKLILEQTRKILNQAILCNGTSISDYRQVDDKTGEFQNFLQVYGKTGEACPVCGTEIIRFKQAQRSSFACENCQK